MRHVKHLTTPRVDTRRLLCDTRIMTLTYDSDPEIDYATPHLPAITAVRPFTRKMLHLNPSPLNPWLNVEFAENEQAILRTRDEEVWAE